MNIDRDRKRNRITPRDKWSFIAQRHKTTKYFGEFGQKQPYL